MIEQGRKVSLESGANCSGQKPLAECQTVQGMLAEAAVQKYNIGLQGEHIWTTLAYLGRLCAECSARCDIQLETVDRQLTGRKRFEFREAET